ncbi:MAG: hypothetical protein AB1485_08475, partial [Candidatus Thermoplasmatota archaeon]
MKRKIALLVLMGLIIASCLPLVSIVSSQKQKVYFVTGYVWDSLDGVEIWNDTTNNWSCKIITVYPVEKGIIEPYTYNGSDGEIINESLRDGFKFDAQWRENMLDKEGICVGEAEKNNVKYVFITNFIYKKTDIFEGIGECATTEWEPMPAPNIESTGATWVNISIKKFENPQREQYNN